jgi:hypothetical protein
VGLQHSIQILYPITSPRDFALGPSKGTTVLSQPKRDPVVLLPLEIIDTICEHLAHSDFKALRSSSRIWQVSADKVLSNVKDLKIQWRNSFERLQSISRHVRLSKLVHCIRYDSRQLEHKPEWVHDYICGSNRRVEDSNPFDCLRYRLERFITLDEPCPFKLLLRRRGLDTLFWPFLDVNDGCVVGIPCERPTKLQST